MWKNRVEPIIEPTFEPTFQLLVNYERGGVDKDDLGEAQRWVTGAVGKSHLPISWAQLSRRSVPAKGLDQCSIIYSKFLSLTNMKWIMLSRPVHVCSLGSTWWSASNLTSYCSRYMGSTYGAMSWWSKRRSKQFNFVEIEKRQKLPRRHMFRPIL